MADDFQPTPVEELTKEQLADRYARGFEPVKVSDWFMVALAILNVAMLVARDAYEGILPDPARQLVVGVDLFLVLLFGVDFLSGLRHASSKLAYTRSHWYDLVGLVPIAHVALRSFRLVRLLRMYTVAHFPPERQPGRGWDQALFRGVIGHYRSVLVEELMDPLLITWIETIDEPLQRTRLAATLGGSLGERRRDLRKAVHDSIGQTRGFHHILDFKKGEQLVDNITDNVLDTLVHLLESDELNDAIRDSLQEVFDDLKSELQHKEYRVKGGGLFRPVG